MIVGLSSAAMAGIALINRNIINYRKTGNFFFTEESKMRVVVVGIDDEVERIKRMIQGELNYPVEIEGSVRMDEQREWRREDCLGSLGQLSEIVQIYKVDEVIFANKDVETEQIITIMSAIQKPGLSYKIVPPGVDYLIGPAVIHASSHDQAAFFTLDQKDVKFKKRLFDVFGSLVLTVLFPLTFWSYRNPFRAFANIWNVLIGKYHLVGYIDDDPKGLPKLKKGVLNMLHRVKFNASSNEHSEGLDRHYARSYSTELDMEILLKGFRNLGRQ